MGTRPSILAAVVVMGTILAGAGSVALAGPGADAIKARGTLFDSPLAINAAQLPNGTLRGTIEDELGTSDVTCMDFTVAEGIPFVPDGSQMARVGAVVRDPIDIRTQIAYILIVTPSGEALVWGPYGFGGPPTDVCELAGFSDSVPPAPFDGKVKLRDN
jgi:hypothetical protein